MTMTNNNYFFPLSSEGYGMYDSTKKVAPRQDCQAKPLSNNERFDFESHQKKKFGED